MLAVVAFWVVAILGGSWLAALSVAWIIVRGRT
jgi:hypothetical protein